MNDGPGGPGGPGGYGGPDLRGIIEGLTNQVKTQAAQINELQQQLEFVQREYASKNDLFQFRGELMAALDGRGMVDHGSMAQDERALPVEVWNTT